jgi:hypothetical protein
MELYPVNITMLQIGPLSNVHFYKTNHFTSFSETDTRPDYDESFLFFRMQSFCQDSKEYIRKRLSDSNGHSFKKKEVERSIVLFIRLTHCRKNNLQDFAHIKMIGKTFFFNLAINRLKINPLCHTLSYAFW